MNNENGKVIIEVKTLHNPIPPGSSSPNIFTGKRNKLYISWTREFQDSVALEYLQFESGKWSEPKPIIKGTNWFVNWADFPAIASNNIGGLLVSYLPKSGKGTYAYNINTLFSSNNGLNWEGPSKLHDDTTKTEHGFVSITPLNNNRFCIGWLDGSNTNKNESEGSNAMTLRAALIDPQGVKIHDQLVDDRVCDCCQTTIATTSSGPIIAFRNRSDKEIRDIYISRLTGDKWSVPTPIFNDNWEIAGCPVNGPSVDANGSHVAIAWFTGANNQPTVKLAFSSDQGESFTNPLIIDGENPVGRVSVKYLPNGDVVVLWIKMEDNKGGLWCAIANQKNGVIATHRISSIDVSRTSGVPKLGLLENGFLTAWTNEDTAKSVNTVMVIIRKD